MGAARRKAVPTPQLSLLLDRGGIALDTPAGTRVAFTRDDGAVELRTTASLPWSSPTGSPHVLLEGVPGPVSGLRCRLAPLEDLCR